MEELGGKDDAVESDLMLKVKDDARLGMDWSEQDDGPSDHRSSDDDEQRIVEGDEEQCCD